MTAVHRGFDRIDSIAEEFECYSPVMKCKPQYRNRSADRLRDCQRRAAKQQIRAQKKETRDRFREIKANVSSYHRELCHAPYMTKFEAAFAEAFKGAATCTILSPSDVPYDRERMDDDDEEAFQFWVSGKPVTVLNLVAGENVRMDVTRTMQGNVFFSATDVAREAQQSPAGDEFYRKAATGGEFEELTRYFWVRLANDSRSLLVSMVKKDWVHRSPETLVVLVTAPPEAFAEGSDHLLPDYRIFTTIRGEHFLAKRVPSAKAASYRNKEFVDSADPRPKSTYASYIAVRYGKSGIFYRNISSAPTNLTQHSSLAWH